LFLFLFASPVLADGSNIDLEENAYLSPYVSSSIKTQQNNFSEISNNNFRPETKQESALSKLFWAIIGGIIGAFIALWLNKFNNPVLEITAGKEANDDN